MKKEIAQKWCKALRSGEYIQGKTYLQDKNNKYCCLGVLCDLAAKEGICSKSNYYDAIEFDNRCCKIPSSVLNWAGMKTDYGEYDKEQNLTSDNDRLNKTFSEIADIIEEKWEQL